VNPHDHSCLTRFHLRTIERDGSEVTPASLPGFRGGLLVAMSNGRVFHSYAWADLIAGTDPKTAAPTPLTPRPGHRPPAPTLPHAAKDVIQ